MEAFDAFLHHLPAMTEDNVTSFHILASEVPGFAYRCLPLLQGAGLPTDHKSCSEAIRSGDFTLNSIRIGVGTCVPSLSSGHRPFGPMRYHTGGYAK